MSFLVVVGVALVAFIYISTTRKARQAWLAKVSLPGQWYCEEDYASLSLQGEFDAGEFVRRERGFEQRGSWRLSGHSLHLKFTAGEGKDLREEIYDLHFFKSGSIGLQNADGVRRLYSKEVSNVVPLRRH